MLLYASKSLLAFIATENSPYSYNPHRSITVKIRHIQLSTVLYNTNWHERTLCQWLTRTKAAAFGRYDYLLMTVNLRAETFNWLNVLYRRLRTQKVIIIVLIAFNRSCKQWATCLSTCISRSEGVCGTCQDIATVCCTKHAGRSVFGTWKLDICFIRNYSEIVFGQFIELYKSFRPMLLSVGHCAYIVSKAGNWSACICMYIYICIQTNHLCSNGIYRERWRFTQ